MKPVDPQVEGVPTVNYAEHQDEYETLPAAVMDPAVGQLYTKWKPTEAERVALAAGAAVELWIWTFGRALQPVAVSVEGVREDRPAMTPDEVRKLYEGQPAQGRKT